MAPTARVDCTNLFLTYPQCDLAKEVLLERIAVLPDYVSCIVCHELHTESEEDHEQGDHLHAFIRFKKRIRLAHTTLDALTGKHGDYQGVRSPKDVVKYIMKDGDYISDGFDPVEFVKPVMGRTERVAALASSGKSFDEIASLEPAFVFMHYRHLQHAIARQHVLTKRASKLPWVPVEYEGDQYNCKFIAWWLNVNIKQPRTFRQKQLFIYSEAGMGKSHLIRWLSKYLMVYDMAPERFQDEYKDGLYDLIVIDEFAGQMPITALNRWLDGDSFTYPIKGAQGVKCDNLPVIILSNRKPEECYVSDTSSVTATQHAAWVSRFFVLSLDERMDLAGPIDEVVEHPSPPPRPAFPVRKRKAADQGPRPEHPWHYDALGMRRLSTGEYI